MTGESPSKPQSLLFQGRNDDDDVVGCLMVPHGWFVELDSSAEPICNSDRSFIFLCCPAGAAAWHYKKDFFYQQCENVST